MFLENLEFYRKQLKIYMLGYVLMPDHYHLLIHLNEDVISSDFLRKIKSFYGKLAVDWLTKNHTQDLELFRLKNTPTKHRDSTYGILQYDNVVLPCSSLPIAKTKLEYIHQNPVKAGLVENPEHYPYSSYRFYKQGTQGKLILSRLDCD